VIRPFDVRSARSRALRTAARLGLTLTAVAATFVQPAIGAVSASQAAVPQAATVHSAWPTAPARYAARVVASLPPYEPREQVTGTIRLWGHGSPAHDFLGGLLHRWESEFHRYQPGVKIVDDMYGTASAIGALYTGAGNLAILGEEISPAAQRAFERERHYAPTRFAIATGSVDVNYFDYAHMIFVNRANPIEHLTVAQLDAIFGDEHRGGLANIRTWGQLGLTGAWARRRIDPYGWKVDQDFALFFRARVLEGSHRWNPDLRQFITIKHADGTVDDRARQILEALARDPAGIAISNVRFANPAVKALRLAATAAGPYVAATPRTLITRAYPLTRIIPAFVDLPPGRALDPAVREFLRFILSRQGQQALIEESGYLPLGRPQIEAQLRRLDALSGCRKACSAAAVAARTVSPERSASAGDRLRVWGNPRLAPLARRWAQGFEALHPGLRVELHMTGSDTAMAGLYTSEADVALTGRTATDSELQAFEWVYRHPPQRVAILDGSVASTGRSPALVAFVHRGNPLRHIDFAQLRGILEARPRPGAPGIRTWGQLGLTGHWAGHPIDLYLPDSESGTGRFLRDSVLGGGAQLDWPRITEAPRASPLPDSPRHTRGEILSALARDPYGLAIAWLPANGEPVTPVPLGARAAGPYLLPAAGTIRDHRYPLRRAVNAYLDPQPRRASEARQFVRYILSAAGQAMVRPADGYLPLMEKAPTAPSARGFAGRRLTPAPSLASIPPQPAAPDSFQARLVAKLPPYVPSQQVSGVIRIWGHGNPRLPWMRHLIRLWAAGFRRFQPRARLEYRMYGTSSGVPALFTGIGDIAILGEEVLPQEVRAFERVKGYPPRIVQVMTGSVDVRNFDYAQQFFVHRGNPLTHLTLAQLDAIFGAQHRRGAANIRTWGQLGLRGAWAGKPITPYGWALDDSFAIYLEQYLLEGSHEWNCALRQYRHIYLPDGRIYDHGQQILDALARDPYGIAVSNIRYAGPEVEPLALGADPAGPFYQATPRTLIERLYPLARTLPAVVDDPPGHPLDPKVREFLRYLLSRDGQQAVNEDGRYLPLDPRLIATELRQLQ